MHDYLILISNEKKYIVAKEGYSFLKSIINEYNDNYLDSDSINFYINDDYELIMCNSVFSLVQKAYVHDPIDSNIIAFEIENLEKNLQKIKGATYFDESDIIRRFETLINSESTSEYEIESYIKKHFRILLGKQYTKVVTQALTNFKLNEEEEERRFDIFAYHKSNNDWELFELKKSNAKVAKQIRNIYSLHAKVHDSIAQLRYYKEILGKEVVKNELKKKYGIEYNVPRFKLIIGTGNDINIRKCEEQVNDIEIITYTQLIEAAKSYYE